MIYGPHELSKRGWSAIFALPRILIWFFARDFLLLNFNVDFYEIPDSSGVYALRVCTWNRRIILTYREYTREEAEALVLAFETQARGNLHVRSLGFHDMFVDYTQVMSFPDYSSFIVATNSIINLIRRALDAKPGSVQQPVL